MPGPLKLERQGHLADYYSLPLQLSLSPMGRGMGWGVVIPLTGPRQVF